MTPEELRLWLAPGDTDSRRLREMIGELAQRWGPYPHPRSTPQSRAFGKALAAAERKLKERD